MAEHAAEIEQDADLETVGGRIKYGRALKGMTQQALADALPTDRKKTRASIAQYEANGNSPSLEVLQDLARVLDQDPRFLAFGGIPDAAAQSIRGEQIPVMNEERRRLKQEHAMLPSGLLEELGATSRKLGLVPLSVDAPPFGARARDYLLVDTERKKVGADGRLYALSSSAGVVLVRSEPRLAKDGDDAVQLTGWQGAIYNVPAASLDVLGRVEAILQKAR